MQDVEDFLQHYGVRGMRWGQRRSRDQSSSAPRKPGRKERKQAEKAAKAAEARKFTDMVLKDIGSRSPSELYVVRSGGRSLMMTGEEFIERTNMGIPFSSIQSSGQRINDGR